MYIYIHTRYVCVCIPTGWGYTYRFTIYSPFWRSHAISSTLLWLLPTHTHTHKFSAERCGTEMDTSGYIVCVWVWCWPIFTCRLVVFSFSQQQNFAACALFFFFFYYSSSLLSLALWGPLRKPKTKKKNRERNGQRHNTFPRLFLFKA